MEILITSKTHKGKAACVGGLVMSNKKFVRLLNPGNWDQYADTNLNVGDVWNIQFDEVNDLDPPHIEDVIIKSKRYVRNIGDISSYIRNCGVSIYSGPPIKLFSGLLRWTSNGSGYIENRQNLPTNSVGFWISDKTLTLDKNDQKHYNYKSVNPLLSTKRLPYVGFASKVNEIPDGILIRVSLARWWKPDNSDMSPRCYLQLSGWYGYPETTASIQG